MKKLLSAVLVVAVIVIGIVVIYNVNAWNEKQELYSSAIAAIENGKYTKAKNLAYQYSSEYGDHSIYKLACVLEYDSKTDGFEKMDRLELYHLEYFKEHLAYFTEQYSGYMSEYILDVKAREEEITRKCEEYWEGVEKAEREAEEERLKELKANPPYEGLSESDIDNTSWGKHIYAEKIVLYTYSEELKKHGVSCSAADGKIYTFSGSSSRYALCGGGRVLFTSLKKIRSNQYYARNKPSDNDKYSASDYSNAEDFYDDNYDYFWDYYEAEEYFDDYS